MFPDLTSHVRQISETIGQTLADRLQGPITSAVRIGAGFAAAVMTGLVLISALLGFIIGKVS